MNNEQRKKGVVTKEVKNHIYTVVNNGFGNYRVIAKEPVFGMWKGVRVGVIRTNGIIATIFPDSKQPTKKRGKN